jgi:uncharacterized protein with GYD domain
MATFVFTGKYSAEALKEMSEGRTAQAVELIGRFGGQVQSMHATLGPSDLLFILSFAGNDEALKASVALSRLTGIAFSTSPAVSVQEFDKLMADR